MGFFRNLLGYNSERGSSTYQPATYTTSVGTPNVTTNTELSASETPAEVKQADTKDYDESDKRRKKKNGVSGSFGFTDRDAISGDGESNQSVGG